MPPADQENQSNPQISEIVKRLDEASNVLITVSKNPSVDQLSACIGITLALNKKDKHATAVFSGAVPSTIEFLEPNKTLEKNTDSLRDFIISLDKSKADKLRYKVENEVVRIFITPYKISISEKDLDFSQGDFNVDVVLALGVHKQDELDEAIVAHGRILHDATIISVNTDSGSDLGSINLQNSKASSLSEVATDIVNDLDKSVIDSQIATAFLTGIVAETDRFRNEKSAPHTMTAAGQLMSAGASTQLVSSKLEEKKKEAARPKKEHKVDKDHKDDQSPKHGAKKEEKKDDGTIEIEHDKDEIHIDESGKLKKLSELEDELKSKNDNDDSSDSGVSLPPPTSMDDDKSSSENSVSRGASIMTEPPKFSGELTANARKVDQDYVKAPDPLAEESVKNSSSNFTLSHSNQTPNNNSPDASTPQTLSDLEKSVGSLHVSGDQSNVSMNNSAPSTPVPPAQEDHARDAVSRAMQGSQDYRPEPTQAIGSNPLGQIDHSDYSGQSQQNNPAKSQGPPPPPVPPPLPS